jgi:hypothetical protein
MKGKPGNGQILFIVTPCVFVGHKEGGDDNDIGSSLPYSCSTSIQGSLIFFGCTFFRGCTNRGTNQELRSPHHSLYLAELTSFAAMLEQGGDVKSLCDVRSSFFFLLGFPRFAT